MTTLLEHVSDAFASSMKFVQDMDVAEIFGGFYEQTMPMTCPICGRGRYSKKAWARKHYIRKRHAWWEEDDWR